MIAVNLMGAVRLTRGVLPPMVAAATGRSVNISSDAGRVGSMGETVRRSQKGGLIAFTKSLARGSRTASTSIASAPARPDTPLFNANPSA